MNYRHAFHAGNFADVVKHLALVAILLHLRKKETPFWVMDSHAGRGLYDIRGADAARTGEARAGIEKLAGAHGSETLDRYLNLVEASGGYPGSPLLAALLLRPQDRLTAIEKHDREAARLRRVLAPYPRARVEEADGYARLVALAPPPERRGLVLMDPPFEAADEFAAAARAARETFRRFANGIYLIWYPVKSPAAGMSFCGEVLADGMAPSTGRALRIETHIAAPEGKLSRAGLLVLNPPFGFATEMRRSLDIALPRLDAQATLDWLVGAED